MSVYIYIYIYIYVPLNKWYKVPAHTDIAVEV